MQKAVASARQTSQNSPPVCRELSALSPSSSSQKQVYRNLFDNNLLPPIYPFVYRVMNRLASRIFRRLPATLAQPTPSPTPPAAAPSTRLALPLPGTDDKANRLSQHSQVLSAWDSVRLPAHGAFYPADIAPGGDAVFVGVGLKTNWPALLAAIESGVFGGRRVAVVRDVFDRSPERQVLSDWFGFVTDDVVAVDQSIVRPSISRRRLVNEFVAGDDGYRLVKNDVELIEYLHASGLRVVPVDSKTKLLRMQSGDDPIPRQQSTNHVLACAPTAFEFNSAAAADNHFMKDNPSTPLTPIALRRQVLTEFAGLHDRLTARDGVGACVHLFTHEDWHNTPDACFPNNTFSTHNNIETGSSCVLVLYPMKAQTRRKERRLVQRLLTRGRYTHVYDLTREEEAGTPRFLEGTGSMVLDRVNRVAYVALSQRSDPGLAAAWARVMDYSLVPFTSVDNEGRAIYHTNVMMSVGTRVAVVCSESIVDKNERETVLGSLRGSGHHVVEIGYDQVERFCGNVIELESFYGEQVMVMSTGAHEAFTEKQREEILGGVSSLVHSDIGTIERIGGGGVRCTIAELH